MATAVIMSLRLYVVVLAVVTALLPATFATAETILVLSDLQLSGTPVGQSTQPGWVAQEVTTFSGTTVLPLAPTASGSAAGITATLVAGGNWEARGGTAQDRDQVAGTSFNSVVSDLWVPRTMSFDVVLGGLAAGSTYRMRTWHNDSYMLNQGFAAGGGTVQISGGGASIVSSTNGTVTNLRGAQTDAAFGIAAVTFVPTVANPRISLTRVGGSITALPVNGVELAVITVPEPVACGGAVIAGFIALVAAGRTSRRRPRDRTPG